MGPAHARERGQGLGGNPPRPQRRTALASVEGGEVPASERAEAVFGQHAHPHQVGDVEEPETTALLQQVRDFVESALRGDFYQDFFVNSRNCTDKSAKTQEFGARLDLIFDRLIAEANRTVATEICTAYELSSLCCERSISSIATLCSSPTKAEPRSFRSIGSGFYPPTRWPGRIHG